jgi:hypothetical protein
LATEEEEAKGVGKVSSVKKSSRLSRGKKFGNPNPSWDAHSSSKGKPTTPHLIPLLHLFAFVVSLMVCGEVEVDLRAVAGSGTGVVFNGGLK